MSWDMASGQETLSSEQTCRDRERRWPTRTTQPPERVSTRDDYTVARGEGGVGKHESGGPGASWCLQPWTDSQTGVCWKRNKTATGLRILSTMFHFS